MPAIIFNGKTYNSLDQMPANERRAFESINDIFADKDGNGIPDIFEGEVENGFMSNAGGMVSYNGAVYNSLAEMPPELRRKMQSAFEVMNEMGLVSKTASVNVSEFKSTVPVQRQSSPLNAAPSAIEEEKGGNTFIGIMIGILLCFGIFVTGFAVLYFMQR